MSKEYDALTRMLLESHPADWLALFGLGGGAPVRVVNSDLSTLTAEADKVLLVEAPQPWIVHVELQSTYKADLPERLLRYHVLLSYRHGMPVHSVLVLLFPEADGPALDGTVRRASPDGRCRLEFTYQVVRVWRESPEGLATGIGTIPLAALAVPSADDLPALVARTKAELARHPTPDAEEIWTALYFLIGRHFGDPALAERLLKEIETMEDSVTYQATIRRGEIREARKILIRQGIKRFQAPSEDVRQRIEGLADLDRLEHLIDRVPDASSWDDLLADSGPDSG
jgi:hypothetical protein